MSWALVGGLAVGARAEPRFTKDVDLAILVTDDQEAESLVHSLVLEGYEIIATVEHDAAGRLSTVRLRPPGGEIGRPVLDLIFSTSGIEADIIEHAEEVVLGRGLRVPVASRGHLIALKLLSQSEHRLQDTLDLQYLIAAATDRDVMLARDACHRIKERGYARDRDLESDLDEALAKWG